MMVMIAMILTVMTIRASTQGTRYVPDMVLSPL